MEFEVGDRVLNINQCSAVYQQNGTVVNSKDTSTSVNMWQGAIYVNFDNGDCFPYGGSSSNSLSSLQLIKKGDDKMEETKEIKGLKVKVGSKIYDTNCSNIGIVVAGTPEHCIYKDLSSSKEEVSPWRNIKLEIQQPDKLLLPKEEKKAKNTAKKKTGKKTK